MTLDEIIGQRAAADLLRRALSSGRMPHALLLQGPPGVGKGKMARALGASMLCVEDGDDACGRCTSCLKVRHGNHPDLLVVRRVSRAIKDRAPMHDAREGDAVRDLSRFIRVFQIRELSEHARFSPREGPWRVFIIDPADRMNEGAQNALLRTLEEPPGQSVLALVSSRPHLLLPTVRSRCLIVRFGPLPADVLARELEARGMARDEAAERASLSRGRPEHALSLDLEGLRSRRDEILEAIEALAASPRGLARLSSMVPAVAGKDEASLLEGLDLLEELLRDSARIASGQRADAALDRELAARLTRLGRRLGAQRAAALVAAVEQLRGELRYNLNRTLLAESLIAAVAGGPLP